MSLTRLYVRLGVHSINLRGTVSTVLFVGIKEILILEFLTTSETDSHIVRTFLERTLTSFAIHLDSLLLSMS